MCFFGLICREIFTPSLALFLASPSACQHVTFAGAAAHLVAVADFFLNVFPSPSFSSTRAAPSAPPLLTLTGTFAFSVQ